MIFCFSISFIVSYFILSKFKFSNNFVIRFIQKTVIFSIVYFVLISICSYFGLIETIYCMGPEDGKYTFEVKGEVSKSPMDLLIIIGRYLLNNLTTTASNIENLFIYSLVFGLTVLIIHLSKKGKLGILLKRFCTSETIVEYLLVLLLVFSIIMSTIHIIYQFNINYSNNNLKK